MAYSFPLAIPENEHVLNRSLSLMSRCDISVHVSEAVAAVEAELPGVAVQHRPTRSYQVVSLGDDPGVVSTAVHSSCEP